MQWWEIAKIGYFTVLMKKHLQNYSVDLFHHIVSSY